MNTCLSPLCVDERLKVYRAYSTQYMADNSSLTYNVKTQPSAQEILEVMMSEGVKFPNHDIQALNTQSTLTEFRSSNSIWIYSHLNPETSKYTSSDYFDN